MTTLDSKVQTPAAKQPKAAWNNLTHGFRHMAALALFAFTPAVASAASVAQLFLDANAKRWQSSNQQLRMTGWQQLIQNHRNADTSVQLQVVNRYINRLSYTPDTTQWGTSDYWATPLELLTRGKGDCEDFALAKYFALQHMGINTNQLKVMYTIVNNANNGAHMVLAFYPSKGAEPLILDSETSDILPISQRPDLRVIYSFNSSGVWKNLKNGRAHWAGSPARLRPWWNVIRRYSEQKPHLI